MFRALRLPLAILLAAGLLACGQDGGPAASSTPDDGGEAVVSDFRAFLDEAYAEATKILKKNNKQLELLAQGLLEYETLNGDEIKIIVEGGTLSREDPADEVETPRAKRKRASIPGTGRPKSPGSESPGSEPA